MGDGGKALTNADFRKILFTPRPGAKPDLAQQAKERKEKKPRPRPPQGKSKPSENETSEGEDGPSYRDRAAERRLGIGGAEQDIAPAVPSGMIGVFAATAIPDLGQMSYEDSKYLGGDTEHTHLVKGLDYALLSKVRSEQHQEEQREKGEDGVGEGVPNKVTFAGPVGRALYNIVFGRQRHLMRADVAERFLPRRTAFIFHMESKDPFEVPTTLHRAKEDCPVPPKIIEASADASVLDRLAKIMAYMSVGSGGKKKIKKERKQELLAEAGLAPSLPPTKSSLNDVGQAEVADGPSKPVDEDEDIFADAGTDYVVERRKETGPQAEEPQQGPSLLGSTATKRSYFGNEAQPALDNNDDLRPIAQPIVGPSAPGQGIEGYPEVDDAYPDTDAAFEEAEKKREERAKKEKQREARHRDMLQSVADGDDGYAECYPSYYDTAGMIYDSEDDDGTGVAKKKVEEETAAAQDAKKEAIKQAVKDKARQEAELAKVQKVFEEKGYGNAQAFNEKPKGNGTKRNEGAEGDDVPVPVLTKRRRI